MTLASPSSNRQIAESLVSISNDLQEVYTRLSYGEDDGRGLVIQNLRAAIGNTAVIFNVLTCLEEGIIPVEQRAYILGAEEKDVPRIMRGIGLNLRLSLITLIQFHIENFFSNLVASIEQANSIRGYTRIVNRVLQLTSSIQDKRQAAEILHVLQHMRNSLHSNGVHNNDSLTITIDSYTFQFEKGKQVTCAGWMTIPIAIRAVIRILEQIVNDPDVRKIPKITLMHIEQIDMQTNSKNRANRFV